MTPQYEYVQRSKFYKILFSFHPSDVFVASVFRGSNDFDYFNIFDYFMNERITTVTLPPNSKEVILQGTKNVLMLTPIPSQLRRYCSHRFISIQIDFPSMNADVFFYLNSEIPLKCFQYVISLFFMCSIGVKFNLAQLTIIHFFLHNSFSFCHCA